MKPKLDPVRGFFNKWEMYKIVKEKPAPYFRIPHTGVFSRQSFEQFISEYECIFIKSVFTFGGEKISKITKENGQLVWKLQGHPGKGFDQIEPLFAELSGVYNDELCIVQEGAPLLMYKERPIDIRAHLQRDLDEKWVYAGDLVRVGGPESIVSNFESNGTVEPTKKVLSTLFKSEERAAQIMENVAKSAMHICHLLDEHDIFMEAGIDFGVDGKGELWLIEVNTNDSQGAPDRALFKRLPDQTYYNDIMTRLTRVNEQLVKELFAYFEEYVKKNKNERV
ncbi:YheC/YheD family protein [Siminovitchia sp. FSL H7-0308]|uniref:YheC/YheD family protein n=1 Tax=unclassified Siminovitchia TaxID=2837530 RepID=UPI0030CE3266